MTELPHEAARLRRLLGLRVMGSAPEGDFDDAVALAADIADVPTALIGLIDDHCQWYKAAVGVDTDGVPREIAVCELVLAAGAPVVIEDMTADPRTAGHPWVVDEPRVRFYAGFPLSGSDGLVVGTLCLVDTRPRTLTERQHRGLQALARQVMAMLDLRRLLLERDEQLARAAEAEQRRARAERQRDEDLELRRAVLKTIPVAIVSCTADGHLQLFNSTARDFHGLGPDEHLDVRDWTQHYSLFRPDGVTPLPREEVPLVAAMAGEDVEEVEIVIAPPGLPQRLVRCTGRRLFGPDGTVTGAVVSMLDITSVRASEASLRSAHEAAQRAAEQLADSERQFRDIFESGPLAIAQLDASGGVLRTNPALSRLLGLTSGDIRTRGLSRVVAASDRASFEHAVVAAGAGAPVGTLEVRLQVAGGRTAWCEVAMSAGTAHDGHRTVLVQLADIDDRKRHELELERRAVHDALTGLPDRSVLREELQVLQDGDGPIRVGMLFLDIDRFKAVNDEHGHHVGDEVLVQVALRLRGLVREQDLVVRLGGDEFVVLHAHGPGTSVEQLARRVQHAFGLPLPTSAGPLVIGVSVGLAQAATLGELDDLTRRADGAMYADKRTRRGA